MIEQRMKMSRRNAVRTLAGAIPASLLSPAPASEKMTRQQAEYQD
jgi:hypothetical protein